MKRLHTWFGCWLILCFASVLLIDCGEDPRPAALAKAVAGKGPRILFNLDAKPLPEIPLPNDLATRIDPTSVTQRRVNVSLVAPTQLEKDVRKLVNKLTGFGIYSPITVSFDKALELGDIIARHQKNNRFQDDVVYLVNLNPKSPNFGKPVLLDMGRGNFPIALERTSNYFDHDNHAGQHNLIYETRNEVDKNGNGKLDPNEDLDHDGVWDKANVYPKGASPKLGALTFYERETRTLIIRPVLPLEEESTYAVILTNRIKGEKGQSIRSPFTHINHTKQTLALRPLVEQGILKKLGLELKDVAFAWSFTTAAATRTLKEIRDGMYGWGPFKKLNTQYPARLKLVHALKDNGQKRWLVTNKDINKLLGEVVNFLVSDSKEQEAVLKTLKHIDYLISGEFVTPYFLTARDKTGKVYDMKDPNLTPEQWLKIIPDNLATFDLDRSTGRMVVGKDNVTWWCTIPKRTEKFKPPFPVVFYGHGYTSSRVEMLGFAGNHAKLGLATCAIDAVGHGTALGKNDTVIIKKIATNLKMSGLMNALIPGRARDLNNDGQADSGGDFWTADTFHTRDVVRQSVIDHMQLIRIMRTWDGKKKWTLGAPSKITGIAGDFNGDGIVDIGGPKRDYYAWGQSLGGILSAIIAGVEPAITAAAPVAGGGGLIQLGSRSVQGGVVEAVFLRMMGPIVVGYGMADGRTELRFWVPDVNKKACSLSLEETKRDPRQNCHEIDRKKRVRGVRFLITDKMKVGDKVVIKNLRSGETRWALVRKNPGASVHHLRFSIPADAEDPVEKAATLGLPRKSSVLQAKNYVLPSLHATGEAKKMEFRTYGIDGKVKSKRQVGLLGDPLEITVYAGLSKKIRATITKTNVDFSFQGALYKSGIPLQSIARGLGLRRQTPELRRFMGFAGMIVEPADPIAFAPLYHLRPLAYPYETDIQLGANVLVIPTIGDMNVPIDSGIAIARAAGILPVLATDARYPHPTKSDTYLTPNQVLLQNFVVEGVEALRNFTNPKTGEKLLFDPDNLSNGTDGYGAPRLSPPMRLTVKTETGIAAMRIPYVNPTGQHGFGVPQPKKPFDINQFMVNQVSLYFRSRGTRIRDDACMHNDSCADLPKP